MLQGRKHSFQVFLPFVRTEKCISFFIPHTSREWNDLSLCTLTACLPFRSSGVSYKVILPYNYFALLACMFSLCVCNGSCLVSGHRFYPYAKASVKISEWKGPILKCKALVAQVMRNLFTALEFSVVKK